MKANRSKVFNAVVAVTFAATVAVAANSPVLASHAAKSAGLKTLKWDILTGDGSWVSTLDPSQITDSIAYNVANATQGNLVKLLPDGKPAPDLAQSYSERKNHKVYTFILRPNLHFADGHKLTAHDVKYSITRALRINGGAPVAGLYLGAIAGAGAVTSGKSKTLSGIRVVNSRKLVITLSQGIPYFLKTLTYPTGDVLDPAIAGRSVKGQPAGTYLTETCINAGAGQFILSCRNHKTNANYSGFFKPGTNPTMTLKPNRHYYGAKPHIKLVLPAIADANTNYRLYKNNFAVDGCCGSNTIPSIDLSSERHSSQFRAFRTSVVDYMTANEHPDSPFHNLHCRLAVAYAIDRNSINEDVLHGLQLSTYQVLPPNLLGYSKKFIANRSWSPHYDVAKAKAELNQCPQLKSGYTVDITYQDSSSDYTSEYTAVTNMLGAVGIKAKLEPLQFNDWLNVVASPKGLDDTGKTGKVDLTENLWIEDYPDPQDYMFNLLHTGANYDIGYFNNKKYNQLVSKADTTFNTKTRANLYIQAQRVALNQGAWIAVGNQGGWALVKPGVKGFVGSAAYGMLVPKNDLWANISVH